MEYGFLHLSPLEIQVCNEKSKLPNTPVYLRYSIVERNGTEKLLARPIVPWCLNPQNCKKLVNLGMISMVPHSMTPSHNFTRLTGLKNEFPANTHGVPGQAKLRELGHDITEPVCKEPEPSLGRVPRSGTHSRGLGHFQHIKEPSCGVCKDWKSALCFLCILVDESGLAVADDDKSGGHREGRK